MAVKRSLISPTCGCTDFRSLSGRGESYDSRRGKALVMTHRPTATTGRTTRLCVMNMENKPLQTRGVKRCLFHFIWGQKNKAG